MPFKKGKRSRLNVVAMWMCLFVPWLVFLLEFGLLSFTLHYELPYFVYTVLSFVLLAILCLGCYSARLRKRLSPLDPVEPEPSWIKFMFVTCLVAWLIGVLCGSFNYATHTQPYEAVRHLNSYTNINPHSVTGQQLMDAGSVTFTNQTRVDTTRAMAFKNLDIYCVAPITVPGVNTSAYDFWAVGLNCCKAGNGSGFGCGDSRSINARGGIRLLHSADRPFYRLAVQQAEVRYNITAAHPLFFGWVENPSTTLHQWKAAAYTNFFVGLFGFFLFQGFLTVLATLLFAQMGRY